MSEIAGGYESFRKRSGTQHAGRSVAQRIGQPESLAAAIPRKQDSKHGKYGEDGLRVTIG